MKFYHSPILKKSISYTLIILMLFQSVGCNYYRVKKIDADFVSTLNEIGELNKYFLIHDGNDTYSLTKISVDSINLYGSLELVYDNIYYENKRGYRYHQDEKDIINEVHFFLNKDANNLDTATTTIPLTDIKEIRIIEKDTGKTVAAYVFGTIGVAAGVVVIVGIIAILTKSSCPYIYVDDGEGFVFEGEIYGGAIAKNLVRDDYMPLPSIQPDQGIYRIRISNELKERQYTDVAELMVVNHTEDQKVLLDKYGQPHLIEKLNPAIKAISFDGSNLQAVLEKKDKEVFLFDNQSVSKNGVTLKFNKPTNATNGNLVFHGKNTLWFDYMFGEFLKKFGVSFDKWMNQQAKLPTAERIQKVIESDFPLSIFIKKNMEWQLVDYLHTVGPLANRDFVVPIDLSDISGDEVEIKFETGFMFWELDFAAMDFSNKQELNMTVVKPSIAKGTGSQNWTAALSKTDSNYMAQENIGEVTEILYKVPIPNQQQAQTVFLHTRGYYELIRDFEGLPKIRALNKFKEPGYFSHFSRDGFLRTLNPSEEFLTQN